MNLLQNLLGPAKGREWPVGNVPGYKGGCRSQIAAAGTPAAASLWWEVCEATSYSLLEAGGTPRGERAERQKAGPFAAPFTGVGSPQPRGSQETQTALCALPLPNALPHEGLQNPPWS